ncbi:MAG TPA: DUF423 domain-containing protein [Acidobacteriota bacterium]|nr:DUF423 domain-containing protein [Acidobacteriota bacterium]
MERVFLILGALSGFLAVAAGAFGAHALRQKIAPEMLSVFETGARYQMYHSLALIGVAWAASHWPAAAFQIAGWCFLTGTILFSGSLYFMALTDSRWVGAITPLGGLAYLLGWLALAWGAGRQTSQ